MKMQWTPNIGLVPVTLGDDAAKFATAIEQLGGQSISQEDALAGGPNLAIFPRGNVGGTVAFRSTKTYASVAATHTTFRAEYGRLNQQGLLELIEGAVVLRFPNSILKGVQRIFDGASGGARMSLRYTFAITTIQ
jgi:hypothetical protein